jgi:hypothetical protein
VEWVRLYFRLTWDSSGNDCRREGNLASGRKVADLPPVGTFCGKVSSSGSAARVPGVFDCRTDCDGVDRLDSALSAEPSAVRRRLCKFESVQSVLAAVNRIYLP